MPIYARWIWVQLRNLTLDEICRALERDGWVKQPRDMARRRRKAPTTVTYRHPGRPPHRNKVIVHPHPKKTMGDYLLNKLLEVICWSESDLVRLKLIRPRAKKKPR